MPPRAARAGAGQRASPEHRHHPRHCARRRRRATDRGREGLRGVVSGSEPPPLRRHRRRRRLARRRGEDRLGERQPRLRCARSPFEPGRRPRDRGRRRRRSRGDGDERQRGGRALDRGRHGSGPACRSRRDRFHGGVAGRRSARAGAGDGGGAASLRRPAAPRRARSPLATRHRGWRRARIGRGLVRGHPALAAVRWLGGLAFDSEDDPSGSPLPEGPPP